MKIKFKSPAEPVPIPVRSIEEQRVGPEKEVGAE